jgi:uncharacterized protein
MKIQLETGGGQNVIRAYGPRRVTINQDVYHTSLILTPDRVFSDWPPCRLDELREEHFAVISELRPELVVLGTGKRLLFPPPAITQVLFKANIGVEVMDTGAACRTYNVLMSEGRRVAAALLMIED